MKSLKISIAILFIGIGIVGCNQTSHSEESMITLDSIQSDSSEMILEESAPNEDSVLSSNAATQKIPNREFVRTADVSMEVKDVYKSTTKVESKVEELGGFVEESQLISSIHSKETFPVNSDSALEIKKYMLHNQMRVRVPQENLGVFLLSLSEEMAFLNYRTISAEDVALEMEWAKLERERLNKTNKELTSLNNQNGKIRDKKEVIESKSSNHSENNRHKINNLELKDKVNYSVVQLEFTEKEKIAETMVFNSKTYEDKYRPDFLYSVGNSFKGGFYLFETLIIGILYLWPLFLVGFIVLIIVLYFKRRIKVSS